MIVSKYTLVLILSLITVFTVQAQRQPSAPAFIVGGFKDMESISTGMPKLYLKFKEVNVPAELHIYTDVGQGFGVSKGQKALIQSGWNL